MRRPRRVGLRYEFATKYHSTYYPRRRETTDLLTAHVMRGYHVEHESNTTPQTTNRADRILLSVDLSVKLKFWLSTAAAHIVVLPTSLGRRACADIEMPEGTSRFTDSCDGRWNCRRWKYRRPLMSVGRRTRSINPFSGACPPAPKQQPDSSRDRRNVDKDRNLNFNSIWGLPTTQYEVPGFLVRKSVTLS